MDDVETVITLALLVAFFAVVALAEVFKKRSGRSLKDFTWHPRQEDIEESEPVRSEG